MESPFWRRCSTCKKEIPFRTAYWICNVSTCNRTRTAFAFCSVNCWDAHVPMLRHRESWAEEARSPTPETGAKTAVLDPIEGLTKDGTDYLSIMRTNLTTLREGQGCS